MDDRGFQNLLNGFWKTEALYAMAALGLADEMGAQAWSADALAGRVGAHPRALYRLLRALSSIGLVRHGTDDRFTLTEWGARLASNAEGSVRGRALHIGAMLAPAFCKLAESVRTGAPPEGIKYGPDGFAELNEDPAQAEIFNQAMVEGSRRVAAKAADAYDFGQYKTFMDVGGGYGAVLSTLLQRLPKASGAVLDLEHAKSGAEKLWAEDGVADRARFIVSSFFEEIPPDADCYILKYIIHDWNDDYARRLMKRLGAAASASGATVILIERIIPERIEANETHARDMLSDLTMLLWDGAERTEAEYRTLFEEAGLSMTRTVPIGDGHYVIEARPA
jgi:hypothetical protein